MLMSDLSAVVFLQSWWNMVASQMEGGEVQEKDTPAKCLIPHQVARHQPRWENVSPNCVHVDIRADCNSWSCRPSALSLLDKQLWPSPVSNQSCPPIALETGNVDSTLNQTRFSSLELTSLTPQTWFLPVLKVPNTWNVFSHCHLSAGTNPI